MAKKADSAARSAAIHLGGFELHAPLARGGMGEVWHGTHRKERVPVAVKVLTAEAARDARFIAAFHAEVRAVAGLDHRGIILVLDHGLITPAAAEASRGALVPGSPWLAMELASHGSLEGLARPLDWRELRYTLLSLLDALSHAHARGVIHRDIKPANVLLAAKTDPRPGLKLTDFGIAHAAGSNEETPSGTMSMGTPAYMAPEQIRAEWRDQGPWTDLYALGCLAYELAAGAPPFQGSLVTVAHGHLKLPPPPLVLDETVPAEFADWVGRLLAKRPADRFLRAADAAWALMGVAGDAAAYASHTTIEVTLNQAQRQQTIQVDHFRDTLTFEFEPEAATAVVVTGAEGISRPPMPATWRQEDAEQASMRLVGAGLTLYGLRTIPLVDRNDARDVMWNALIEVDQTRTPRLLLLGGAAGTGKSRLVEWVAERAHEVGAATMMRAVHSASGGPADGIGPMIARYLRCSGLPREDVAARIEHMLRARGVTDEYEWNALTELVAPLSPDATASGSVVRFSNPAERHVLVRRLIEREGVERPLIVWLDDVQWGEDALGFAQHLMTQQTESDCPVLLLLTARDELLENAAGGRKKLLEVLERPDASLLPVGPLADEDQSRLVQQLLGLEGELARQVEQRTGGNPLFAVQLVGDWVQRGVLEPGSHGFVLRKGETARLPDDIHQVWAAHLERVLMGRHPSSQPALELAAALGGQIDKAEWSRSCEMAGIVVEPGLLQTLLAAKLVTDEGTAWAFTHGMLRESLERSARLAERWQAHNHACARMLRCYPEGQAGTQERLGKHLIEAGRPAEAVEPLLVAAEQAREQSRFRTSHDLLDLAGDALDLASVPAADDRWGRLWNARSWVFRSQWDFDTATQWAQRATDSAAEHAWEAVAAEATWGLAWIARQQGDPTAAQTRYRSAYEQFATLGDTAGMARSINGLAILARQHKEPDAPSLYLRAQELYASIGDRKGVAGCVYGRGSATQQAGDNDGAEALITEAMSIYREVGAQQQVASCHNVLAEISRSRGDLAAAEVGYRRAFELHRNVGSGSGMIPRLNLSIVLIERGQFAEAKALLEASRKALELTGQKALLAFVHVALAAVTAATRNWLACEHHTATADTLLGESGMIDADVARLLELAANKARDAERTGVAAKVERMAAAQRAALS